MIETGINKSGTNVLYDKAFEFAVRIIHAYIFLAEKKKMYVLAKQLLRSGTSIGANVVEANGGISKADFSSKISIAYKECLETKYWLTLLYKTKFIDAKTYASIYADAEELSKMLFAILRKTRSTTK
jgi:four helix bundle protein